MILTEQQQAELLEASKPLMKWLANNVNPHCSVVVDSTTVELLESQSRQETTEFVEEQS